MSIDLLMQQIGASKKSQVEEYNVVSGTDTKFKLLLSGWLIGVKERPLDFDPVNGFAVMGDNKQIFIFGGSNTYSRSSKQLLSGIKLSKAVVVVSLE